jgi:hypothetical protein
MRPLLVVNPRADRGFVELANRLVEDGSQTPEALQKALRPEYPRVIVRRRMLSAEMRVTWYVYREGRWIPNLID